MLRLLQHGHPIASLPLARSRAHEIPQRRRVAQLRARRSIHLLLVDQSAPRPHARRRDEAAQKRAQHANSRAPRKSNFRLNVERGRSTTIRLLGRRLHRENFRCGVTVRYRAPGQWHDRAGRCAGLRRICRGLARDVGEIRRVIDVGVNRDRYGGDEQQRGQP